MRIISIYFIISTCLIQVAVSKEFDLSTRLKAKDEYRKSYYYIFGVKEIAHLPSFKNIVQTQGYFKEKKIMKFIKELDQQLPSEYLRAITYWTFISKNGLAQRKTLQFARNNLLYSLRDKVENPLADFDSKQIKSFLKLHKPSYDPVVNEYISPKNMLALLKSDPILKYTSRNTSLYSLSPLGFIPGNQVKLISKNEVGLDRIEWFNKRVIFAGGTPNFDAPYVKMPTKEDPTGHLSFIEDPIFIKIRDMIDEAQESIFIDIFLFGGTFGMTVAEYLIDESLKKQIKNPDFKVLLLHDYATNYNMKDEIMPVFNYIKERIDKEPKVKSSFYLLQANIQRHPPGIPFGITDLIPKTKEVFKIIENKSTYYESKIDHSKVIVIDANTNNAQAYFGSKNWSDHSGGYYYDDAIWVKGPAAAAVQASYYDDVEAALTQKPQELDWMYYKDQGFDNKHYLPLRMKILNWFKITKKTYAHQGDQIIRIAEADIDGKVKNVRNMLVEMIMHAKKNIYMEQLFIYDPYINQALIKRKKQLPELEIKILADHNGNFGFNGFPNTIFMSKLSQNGIQIKARKTLGVVAHFPNATTQAYHQENHRKITSVDGRVILGGSSNLNPDTLQGSFREFGAQIYDQKEIKKFEQSFLRAWNDDELTHELHIETNQLKIGDKLLSIENSRMLNDFALQLMMSKDSLEERY